MRIFELVVLVILSTLPASAAVHNPALKGGRIILLKDPVNSLPLELSVLWPYGPPPESGTLTVTVENGSDKVDIVGGSSTSTRSWSAPPYPATISIKPKAVSSQMNDVKVGIRHEGSAIATIELTVITVTPVTKNLRINKRTTPPYYSGAQNPEDSRYGIANTMEYDVSIAVRPRPAVDSVTPYLVQFGSGDDARYYRNPPNSTVTKSVGAANNPVFDGEFTSDADWVKDTGGGVWITSASASDIPEFGGRGRDWTKLTRTNSFTVYVQMSLDGGETWDGLLQGSWSFLGACDAGPFADGAYPISGIGATIVVSSPLEGSSGVAPSMRSPDLNSVLANRVDQ